MKSKPFKSFADLAEIRCLIEKEEIYDATPIASSLAINNAFEEHFVNNFLAVLIHAKAKKIIDSNKAAQLVHCAINLLHPPKNSI
jgi:hypothetical protein